MKQDSWIWHNTDKLILFILLILGWSTIHFMIHNHVAQDALTWAENSVSTVLGALILILTGRVQRANQDDQPKPPEAK